MTAVHYDRMRHVGSYRVLKLAIAKDSCLFDKYYHINMLCTVELLILFIGIISSLLGLFQHQMYC